MQLFYYPKLDNSTAQFVFTPEESHHIVKVLRKKENDTLLITNGKGRIFEAKILLADAKKCKAQITSTKKKHRKMYWFHLVVAPTKIGIDEITPIICDRSERKVIKPERMEKVLQSAMKQSMQAYLPKLNPAVTYNEFIEQEREGLLFIAHCEDDEKMELKRRVAPDKDITILIGPEGDFSRNEIDKAYEKGFLPVSLGQNRLRTETAAIVACTTVNLINNG